MKYQVLVNFRLLGKETRCSLDVEAGSKKEAEEKISKKYDCYGAEYGLVDVMVLPLHDACKNCGDQLGFNDEKAYGICRGCFGLVDYEDDDSSEELMDAHLVSQRSEQRDYQHYSGDHSAVGY